MRSGRVLGIAALVAATALTTAPRSGVGHGDVQPQAVDTTGLKPLGDELLMTNPYRGDAKAIEIGASGYNSNCARCHGLEAISGGIAPDLRMLPEDESSDEWYINRVRSGATQNGVTKMPAFSGIISEEAMWAIRSYIDSRPDE
jgi:cytochrome c-550 PedF